MYFCSRLKKLNIILLPLLFACINFSMSDSFESFDANMWEKHMILMSLFGNHLVISFLLQQTLSIYLIKCRAIKRGPYCAFGFYLKNDTSVVIQAADNLLPNGIGENNGPSNSLRTSVFFRIIDRHVDFVDMSKTRTVFGLVGTIDRTLVLIASDTGKLSEHRRAYDGYCSTVFTAWLNIFWWAQGRESGTVIDWVVLDNTQWNRAVIA